MSMRYPGGFIASTPVTANYPSGVWTQAQAIPYQAQNVWTRDQYWPYTTLLLQGNGTNGAQNNTFLDSSSNNFTITRNGNTTQGAFTPYEANGYWSNYFEGTSNANYLSIARLLDSTADITLECWVFMTAGIPTNGAYVAAQFTAGGADRTVFGVIGAGNLVGMQFGTTSVTSTAAIQLNQWVHLAWVRSGNGTNNWSQYINGVRDGQLTYTGTYQNTPFTIGASNNIASSQFPGYISNMRLVKGTAVYSGTSFTPPSAPLTAITNTVLLTCQGNRFLDSSASPNTITVNGSPSVQAFQPFPGATTYSGTVLGGSGYFDGSGDYLQTPSNSAFNFSATDCTIEFWYYGAASSGLAVEWGTGASGDMQVEFSSGTVTFGPSGGASKTFFALQANAWNYIAAVKTGTTYYIFINGTRNTSSSGTAASSAQIVNIGCRNGGTVPITGYIADLRVSNTARYTNTTMTVPTAPLTNITNTSLLLNFTNAGIFDAAVMNDLETVGNAQVSTSVVKYGTGSMYFDGTGDWLTLPSRPALDLGTGDFTIEFWTYLNTTAIGQGFVGGTASGAYDVRWVSNVLYLGRLLVALDSSFAWTPSANTWYHVALSRSGSSLRAFVNGVQIGSTATNTNTYNTAGSMTIGVSYPPTPDYPMNGYIDDLRITKGAARYITNFTPPPARMPGQ